MKNKEQSEAMAVNPHEKSEYTTPLITEKVIEKNKSERESIDITKSVVEEDKHLVRPAGVGAAVFGFVFGGPILSALLGFSAAYAVRKKDSAGNLARALGELTISAQEKTARLEEKTRIGEKTTKSINDFCDDEREESLAFKTRAFLVSVWLNATKFTKDNQLIERGVEGTGKGLEFIGKSFEKLTGKKHSEDEIVFVSSDDIRDVTEEIKYAELVSVTTD